jgi:CRP/FNR family transcriptional regulator, dissimilatory nitrate respiration regulator
MKTNAESAGTKVKMLRCSDVFNGVSEMGLQSLADVAILQTYAAGESLFYQEQQASGFYVLVEGALTVYRAGMDGRQQILHVFDEAGDVCGEVPVFEGTAYPAAADATEPSRVLYLSRPDFLAVTRRHPEILLQMLAELSRRLRRFVGLIDDLSLKDVSTRLAAFLLELADASGRDTFTLGMTKGMLAARLGTIPETLSRTLRKLQQAGLAAVDGRTIRILDRDRLDAIGSGEEAL